jgi:hypothetical protein
MATKYAGLRGNEVRMIARIRPLDSRRQRRLDEVTPVPCHPHMLLRDREAMQPQGSRQNSVMAVGETGTRKMRKVFRSKLNGDQSRDDGTASFTLPFDTREVWGKAKVPVKVTINGYTWRSTVGNRGGIQYLVVNADARRHAGVKAGDTVTIVLAPDTEKRDIEIPIQLQKALGAKLTEKLNFLSFSHKKEFVFWYSEAKKEDTRARRVEKMKAMLSEGKVIS